ncbi:MAG: methylmalonyl-CoA epimerase [Alphaproteobacteria bacterium]|nr:methylmalonyl-CoA epimerase [Alphaproteobacteria bacterium]
MIGNLNHIAIAVPNLELAINQYQNVFGAFTSTPRDLTDHGVRIAMVKLPNTTIELITPLGENSPIQGFLDKHPQGGLHHLCYEVTDLAKAKDTLSVSKIQVIGDGEPKLGFHGNPVLFFNPKDCLGVLIELEEISVPKVQSRVEIDRIGPAHTFPQFSTDTMEGVEGIGIGINVDFKKPTPEDNKETE